MTRLPSTTLVLLTMTGLSGLGCDPGSPEPPPPQVSSGTTDGPDPSTSGASASATSTSGMTSGTSTMGADSTTVGASDDETDTLFIIPTDGGSCASSGELFWRCSACHPFLQDCGNDAKCTPWANDGGSLWNATRCSPIPERPVPEGETCTVEASHTSGVDDCEPGTMCWGVDPDTLQGTCRSFCDSNAAMPCAEGEVCLDDEPLPVYLCLSRCDPLDPGSCGADESCRDVRDEALCLPTASLPDGLPCGDGEQYCGADQACLPWGELATACGVSECCTPWCDLSAPDPDAACTVPGEVCRPFHEAGAPAGYSHVGVCGLPL